MSNKDILKSWYSAVVAKEQAPEETVNTAQQHSAKSFGERLLMLIRQNNIVYKDVADVLNVSITTVGNWTKPNVKITDENLYALADYFDVSYIWMRYGNKAREDAARYLGVSLDSINGIKSDEIIFKNKIIRAFLDMTNDEVYFIAENDEQFINFSQSVLDNTGYSAKELMTMAPYDIKPNLSKERYREMCDAVTETDPISFNVDHIRRDSSIYNIDMKFRKVESSTGNVYIAIGRAKHDKKI